MNEQELRALLGLSADADLKADLVAMKEAADAADELEADVATLSAKIAELEKLAIADDDSSDKAKTEAELAAKNAQIINLTQKAEAFESESVKLSQRLVALEEERAERSAQDRINLALKDRKVTPAELKDKEGFLMKLAKTQPETFDNIMAVRPASAVNLTVELGSGNEGTSEEDPADQLFRLTDEVLATHADLSPQDARKQVLLAHPELRGAIKTIQAG